MDHLDYERWIKDFESGDIRPKAVFSTQAELVDFSADFFYICDKAVALSPYRLESLSDYLTEETSFLYFDNDEINEKGERCNPNFKPDYSPDYLLNQDYIGSFLVFRKGILPEPTISEDFDLYAYALAFIDKIDRSAVKHVPHIFYHIEQAKKTTLSHVATVKNYLETKHISATVTEGKAQGLVNINYALSSEELVSIIIPTRNGLADLEKCLDSLLEKTAYSNYEIIVADNGSTDEGIFQLYKTYEAKLGERFRWLSVDIPFNYSTINNEAAKLAKGKYLLFLNNDTEISSESWLTTLVSFGQFDRIGCVGAKLYHEDNSLQHAGVIVGLAGDAAPTFTGYFKDNLGYQGRLFADYNYSAVTAACLLLKKSDFEAAGGFDDTFAIAFNDVDLCLKVKSLGRDNVLAHQAELYHYESKTRGIDNTDAKLERLNKEAALLCQKWPQYVENDPAFNPNLWRSSADFSILPLHGLEAYITELKNQVQVLEGKNKKFQIQNQELSESRSYKLGNSVIRPVKTVIGWIRSPILLRMQFKEKRLALGLKLRKIPSPHALYLRQAVNKKRKNNNYTNPKRQLIYVIFEDQPRLQDYKVLFLDSLAKISERVLIVVNGTLPDADIETLSAYGQVELRDNRGYDAAAFKYGVQKLGQQALSESDELLLVNDTNVGPFVDLSVIFAEMAKRKVDFWGLSYGDAVTDQEFIQHNKYGYIPPHLQSYFLVVEKSLLSSEDFFEYWENLGETNSREEAVGKHETVFTKHFLDLGYKPDALSHYNHDSATYFHPLTLLKKGFPLVKYAAFANDTSEKFEWYGLKKKSEVPDLLDYIKYQTTYPMSVIDHIMDRVRRQDTQRFILIIDGVENAIPQCTRYRVENKAEQLRAAGYQVRVVSYTNFKLEFAEFASHIIIYRAPYTYLLGELVKLANKHHKPIYYDIDDLVIDTKYTNQLSYTQHLSEHEKRSYDAGVKNYGRMLSLCDGAITSTERLQTELRNYQKVVWLNRNVASRELVALSQKNQHDYSQKSAIIRLGYFSGSITHNENFELIKPALLVLLKKYPQLELNLVGHLTVSKELEAFSQQIKTHSYVDWQELPQLIGQMDINLAPLVTSIFNEAKSEIKWIEAALVKVPTAASRLGSFEEMIKDGETGLLVSDKDWFDRLEMLIKSAEKRESLAEAAYSFVMEHCTSSNISKDLVEAFGESSQ